MAFNTTILTGNDTELAAFTTDATNEGVVNALYAENTTGGSLDVSFLIGGVVSHTISIAATTLYTAPDKFNVGTNSGFSVNAATGITTTVCYLHQSTDAAGALTSAQQAASDASDSATAAATSETNAGTSETNAGTSATNAEASAVASALSAGIEIDDVTPDAGKVYSSAKVVSSTLGATNSVVDSYSESLVAVAALDIDLATGNYFTKTLSTTSTLTFSNALTDANSFTLRLVNGDAQVVTWPASVTKWKGGAAPTLAAECVLVFDTLDSGVTFTGYDIGEVVAI